VSQNGYVLKASKYLCLHVHGPNCVLSRLVVWGTTSMWRGTVEYTKVTKVLYQKIVPCTGVDKKILQWIVIHPRKQTWTLTYYIALFHFHTPMRATIVTNTLCSTEYIYDLFYFIYNMMSSTKKKTRHIHALSLSLHTWYLLHILIVMRLTSRPKIGAKIHIVSLLNF
jgi:hypothetical protein